MNTAHLCAALVDIDARLARLARGADSELAEIADMRAEVADLLTEARLDAEAER